jgi:hypothetical protein
MPYREVMGLPVKTFWLMSGNIRRIRAGDDMRQLMTATAAQSAEGVGEYRQRLILDIGTVFKDGLIIDAERDEAGFAELKMMAAGM